MLSYTEIKDRYNTMVGKWKDSLAIQREVKPKLVERDKLRDEVDKEVFGLFTNEFSSPDDFIKLLEALELTINETRIRKAWDNTFNPNSNGSNDVLWHDVVYESIKELKKKIRKEARA